MYWTIDEPISVQPDVEGEARSLPDWSNRTKEGFTGRGHAGLEVDKAGDILKIIDTPTGAVMFGVKRDVVFEFAKMGTRIYVYSDFIGPLIVTIPPKKGVYPGLKMALPRREFFEHRDRALALFAAYDRQRARIVNMEA